MKSDATTDFQKAKCFESSVLTTQEGTHIYMTVLELVLIFIHSNVSWL